MKLGKLKKSKAETFRDYPEPKEMSIEQELKTREKLGRNIKVLTRKTASKAYASGKRRFIPTAKEFQERQLIKQQKYDAKIKRETLKAELAEAKQRRRAASPLKHVGAGISKIFDKPDRPSRVKYEQTSLQLEKIRRDREMMRQRQTYEREQQARFGVRPEGDGELPYYKPDHKKPLRKKCSPAIGVANHERIPKKRNFKDEVL